MDSSESSSCAEISFASSLQIYDIENASLGSDLTFPPLPAEHIHVRLRLCLRPGRFGDRDISLYPSYIVSLETFMAQHYQVAAIQFIL